MEVAALWHNFRFESLRSASAVGEAIFEIKMVLLKSYLCGHRSQYAETRMFGLFDPAFLPMVTEAMVAVP